jgi:ribonuclease HI
MTPFSCPSSKESETTYIYTDASFSKQYEIAVIGFAHFQSRLQHETIALQSTQIQLLQINERNNIRAEIRSAISALEACAQHGNIILFSDCETVVNLPLRRKKLESTNFISKSKDAPLANTDLYREFYKTFDSYSPNIVWVKGHTPTNSPSFIETNFSILDKMIRNRLRNTITRAPDTKSN